VKGKEGFKMKTSKKSRAWRRYLLLVAMALHLTVFSMLVSGQEIQEAVREPIRIGFESWSLFVVCNQAWLHAENQEKLLNLYHQFGAFGRVIGRKHLAVWFWKNHPKPGMALADYVDAERSSDYCAHFKLLPSEGPHILITTTYPDLSVPVGNYFVLKLNDASSSDVTALLNKLSNQLVVTGLNQTTLDSEQYWRAWQRNFEEIRKGAAGFIRRVTLTIDTKFFKIEIKGGSS
jgi:hypothetical protein